jgi:hypothetical protein
MSTAAAATTQHNTTHAKPLPHRAKATVPSYSCLVYSLRSGKLIEACRKLASSLYPRTLALTLALALTLTWD